MRETTEAPQIKEGDALMDRLEALISELSSLSYEEDYERFEDIVSELVNHGEVLSERLEAMAESLSYQERRAAVEAMGHIEHPRRNQIILSKLEDANWKVRQSAASAVSLGVNIDHSKVRPILIKQLDDSHRELRLTAIDAVGALQVAEAAPKLEGLLSHADWRVRQDTVVALGKIGEVRSFAPLIRRFTDDDEDVRNATQTALAGLLTQMKAKDIEKALADVPESEQRDILAVVEKEASQLEPVLEALKKSVTTVVDDNELAHFGRVMSSPEQLPTLDQAFERDREVEDLLKIVLKPDGNRSVILVGDAGVGKTAIVHEVARRVAAMDPPYAVLETSTPELMVGTKYIGEWETKLRDLVEKIKAPRRVLLNITNVNDLPGAGTTSSSKQNFATLLAPYMRRGDIAVIGESNAEAMRTGVEKDLSVKRLFQTVKIAEPDRATTLRVLRHSLGRLSKSHGVDFVMHPEVIDLLIELSGTYYATMAQPGRSVTVLKQVIDYIMDNRDEADTATRLEIHAEHVIRGLARFTGLPELLLNDELALDTDEVRAFFTKRVLGQDEAVDSLVDLITLIKAGLTDPGKPFGVFLFVGPTGVGKTELAKALAEFIFGSPERMLRFDLSEYKDYESFEKLIGGTYRNRDGGQLTSKVREQPFSVILLDEFEKAHRNVFDLFLQVFDDGRLTDARGRMADFRHTIIIMTSNIASDFKPDGMGFGGEKGGVASESGVLREVQKFFRPEFLNRIDKTIVFRGLQEQTMRLIALRELGKVLVRSGLLRRRLVVDIEPSVVDYLLSMGFSQAMGARPLRRAVDQKVLLPVAREIVRRGPGYTGEMLRVYANDDGLHVERTPTAFQDYLQNLDARAENMLKDADTFRGLWEKKPRSWKKAKELVQAADIQRHRLIPDEVLKDVRERIDKAELSASAVTFWDDPKVARQRLLEAVELRWIHDFAHTVLAQAERVQKDTESRTTTFSGWHALFKSSLTDIARLHTILTERPASGPVLSE